MSTHNVCFLGEIWKNINTSGNCDIWSNVIITAIKSLIFLIDVDCSACILKVNGYICKFSVIFTRKTTFEFPVCFPVHYPLLKRGVLCKKRICFITKTYVYSFDLLQPHFYVVKLGFTGVYIIFLISAQKHRLWVLVRTASARRF